MQLWLLEPVLEGCNTGGKSGLAVIDIISPLLQGYSASVRYTFTNLLEHHEEQAGRIPAAPLTSPCACGSVGVW
jgi:hypothetical protein